MTLEEKIGQMFVLFAYGPDATKPDARNTTLYGVPTPAEVIAKYKPGGWIYFNARGNVENPTQLATYSNQLQQAALKTGLRVPLTIATDQEQGVVVRIGPPATQFGGNMAHGATRNTKDARTAAGITGRELKAMGIRQDYAPVADVNVNALNPVIGVRSFSSDPKLVSDMTAAQVKGYQNDAGIMATAKHFPGHGDTVDDSHTSLPTINHTREQWNTIDAPPFKAAIKAGIDSIMTAHIVVPSLDPSGDPATLSKPILTGVLRNAARLQGTRHHRRAGDGRRPPEVWRRRGGCPGDRGRSRPAAAAARAGRPVQGRRRRGEVGPDQRASGQRERAARPVDEAQERRPVPPVRRSGQDRHHGRYAGQPGHRAEDRRQVRHGGQERHQHAAARQHPAQGPRHRLGRHDDPGPGQQPHHRGATTTVAQTGAQPTDAAITDAVTKAQANDVTVVLTQKAWDNKVVDPNAKQQKLVKDLLATGKTVIVVAVRDPYDIAYFTAAPTYVATYGYAAVSMESLAKVLYGEISPTGKLPVDIPVAGDPATPLYKFGHGLTW